MAHRVGGVVGGDARGGGVGGSGGGIKGAAQCRWRVSIHNLRTVAPRYGELLALLVYLTWLLHWFPSSNPTSFRAFLG